MSASLRARAARRSLRAGMKALRAVGERSYGPDALTADGATEVFGEEEILRLRSYVDRLSGVSRTVGGVDEHEVPGSPVPTWRMAPRRPTEGRVVLYLHGGAFVGGSHLTHRVLASAIARVSGADVVLPEYRLAPQHVFPAAVDDAVATYRWLLDRGVEPSRIVVAGDSAGGGLAISTVLAVRDRGLPLPAGIVGLSPWTDLTASGGTISSNAQVDLAIDGPMVAVGGTAYAPGRESDPLASPLFADLTDLPPMLVHVGTHEVLLDDSRRLVERAREAGVAAELGEFDGMWHVFQAYPGLPETSRSLREIGAWIRRVIDQPASVGPS